MKNIKINNFNISNTNSFCLIAGPCVIESRDHTIKMAELIHGICQELKINFIFKASFDKANRTSAKSIRGVGLDKALDVFNEIKTLFHCPIITDIHNESQCNEIAKSDIIDILQIPAFLCRQTDLLIAAGKSQKIINVKKGQFLSPHEMTNVIDKILTTNNQKIMLTERGASFGYNSLVSDFRSIEIMKRTGYPVIFDATHSVQEPGALGNSSGGKREFVPALSKAAVAVGVAGIFIETHDDPDNAPSDGSNMLNIKDLKKLLLKLKEFDSISKSQE
jgi:2-dehydro-3-deoxyphosphooctonate aldolase (KDO 8-P synthase)